MTQKQSRPVAPGIGRAAAASAETLERANARSLNGDFCRCFETFKAEGFLPPLNVARVRLLLVKTQVDVKWNLELPAPVQP